MDAVAAAAQPSAVAAAVVGHVFAAIAAAGAVELANVTREVHFGPENVGRWRRCVRPRPVPTGPFTRTRKRVESAHSIRAIEMDMTATTKLWDRRSFSHKRCNCDRQGASAKDVPLSTAKAHRLRNERAKTGCAVECVQDDLISKGDKRSSSTTNLGQSHTTYHERISMQGIHPMRGEKKKKRFTKLARGTG